MASNVFVRCLELSCRNQSQRKRCRIRLRLEQLEGRDAPAAGTLDATFGTGGKVITEFGFEAFAQSMVLDGLGRIVVAGYANVGSHSTDFALARYNLAASLDNSFGSGGKVTAPIGADTDLGQS